MTKDLLIRFVNSVLTARDSTASAHAQGVARVAEAIAVHMGFDEERLERLRTAALLHDIGKVAVPESILSKKGRLTPEEYRKATEHSRAGYEILCRFEKYAPITEIVLHHHEWYDGTGYPDGLSGKDIPLECRILCVADAYDTMTSNRPYRKRMDHASACEEINSQVNGQFCPEVVRAFNEIRHTLGRPKVEEKISGFEVEGSEETDRVEERSVTKQEMTVGDDLDFAKMPEGPAAAVAAKLMGGERTTLDRIRPGMEAVVERLDGDADFRRRLLELGLLPGVRVAVVRTAPLGDPLEVELRGSSFTLRKSEGARIAVIRESEDAATFLKVPRPDFSNAPASRRCKVAVAGIPNTGKTTLFNALTHARGKVGNYPGITVERLAAVLELEGGPTVEFVDVPGTYSLNARSREEQVAIDEILGRTGSAAPDLVMVVLNAVTLERSLYLLFQIQELGYPVIAVVNMMDEASSQGVTIDLDGLSRSLQVPVLGVSARTGDGVEKILPTLGRMLKGEIREQEDRWRWEPDQRLSDKLDRIVAAMGDLLGPDASVSRRWAFALWCLMSISADDELKGIPDDLRRATLSVQKVVADEEIDLDLDVTQARYELIDQIMAACVERRRPPASRDITRRLDSILTHPFYGSLVFLLTMAVLFAALFDWSAPLIESIKWLFSKAGDGLRSVLGKGLLSDLMVDGVVAGVGSVLVFLPQILILFFFIALLESSGYLSRAAFIIDRLMRRLGMSGKGFIPMLSGFACAVPAVMATRTLENRRDRLLAMMVIPLISCSARLPVYTLVIAALYEADKKILGPISLGMAMMFGLYILSTVMALVAAGVLGRFVLKGKPQPLLLELPPYRLPSLKECLRVLKDRTLAFLKTAGTVILVASVILWVLLTFPRTERYSMDYDKAIAVARKAKDTKEAQALEQQKRAEELHNSMAGRFGRLMEPLIQPLGFDWKIGIGLIGSFAAREVFISTMGQVYAVGKADGGDSLKKAMKRQRRTDGKPVYTPLTGLSLLVFFMLALQCLSTVAVVRQESGSWKWVGFQFAYMTVLAYLGSLSVYQIGRLLGFG